MPARILIIENHPDNQKLMAYLLEKYGYTVQIAGTGEEGVELALGGEFDLILCDIRMAGMDGYAVARRLRAEPGCSNARLIAVTALTWPDNEQEVLAAGFNGYISKAIAPKLFIQQVQSFLSESDR